MDAAHQPRLSPDRGRLITLVQPFLRRDDVHAPQTPVVAVGRVGILLHLERVVLDVVYGRQDDAGVILLHPGQDGFSPLDWEKTQELRADFRNQACTKLQRTVAKAKKEKKKKNWEIKKVCSINIPTMLDWRNLNDHLVIVTGFRMGSESCECSLTWKTSNNIYF